jgi:plastocyanin
MRALAVTLLALALLAGCGGGGGGAAQPAGSIKVTMTEYSFNPSTISVPSGKVVFFLVNAGTVSHDMVVRDASGQKVSGATSELVSAGDSFVFTVTNLAAGSYTFFCDQPGHEASGMKGTLTAT